MSDRPIVQGDRARPRVVVLGAGFGGLEVATTLAREFGAAVDVVLLDAAAGFVFGFSKLDVMFGKASAEHVVHSYADVARPGLRFVQTTVRGVDPVAKRVTTDDGTFDADILVVALGADLDPAATPGLIEGGHDFYSLHSALALRQVLADFAGGRVVIGVTSTPFKCPPAPSETALLMHDLLDRRGLLASSHVSLVMPLPVPIPPSPDASRAVLAVFAERGISWHPGRTVLGLDPGRRVALLSGGQELAYDLFLGVPVHRAPRVVVEAGMTVDGWIPVDPMSLETRYPDVYAVGDVTSVGTPKAGVFAEGQAAVVAAAIGVRVRGKPVTVTYGGRGVCYMEFGHDMIATVDVTFLPGRPPTGDFAGPSTDLAADKSTFGSERAERWFSRHWAPLPRQGHGVTPCPVLLAP